MQKFDTSCGLTKKEIDITRYAIKKEIGQQLPLLPEPVETRLFFQGRDAWTYRWGLIETKGKITVKELMLEVTVKLKKEFHPLEMCKAYRFLVSVEMTKDIYNPKIKLDKEMLDKKEPDDQKNEVELYTLTISNTWDPTDDKNFWECTAQVPNILTLYDLHLFIQKAVDFDNDHLFDFYAGRHERNRKIVFATQSGQPYDGCEYQSISLKNIYPLKGLKLYYLFDYGDNWVFEIRKSRKKAKFDPKIKYPHIISDNGVKLRQYYYEDDDYYEDDE